MTKRDVLLREWEIVQTARDGVAACHPLVTNPRPVNAALDDEQRNALEALLSSTDTVSVFRGGAGTGKSFVLRELAEQLQQAGRPVVVLAPQRQQVVDMEKSGLPSPTTIANFLLKRELADRAVIVVDEAGQIGGRQMLELLRLARDRNARVILSGDTRQHGAVEASDALLAIERHSGVKPVELHKIRRQDPALARDLEERRQIRQYRKAVESAAAGKVAESFERLDKLGAVVACGLGDQADKLADEYLRLAEQNASAVVVSQTWAEVHRVNSRVRDALKAKGLLGSSDAAIQVLDRLDLTNAQKRDERFYPKDAVVVFNQKIREAEPGAKGQAGGHRQGGRAGRGRTGDSSPSRTKCSTGFQSASLRELCDLDLATACTSRPIANLLPAVASPMANCVRESRFARMAAIELTDGRVLDSSFREFLPGYAVTSYGSQGKTVDYVLFSDSTIKAATNAQQWYVTISRGRRGIRIFTPDKEQLRENVTRSGHRPLAMELAGASAPRRVVHLWDRLHGYLLRFGRRAADRIVRLKKARLRHRNRQLKQKHEHQNTRMLGERPASPRRSHRIVP